MSISILTSIITMESNVAAAIHTGITEHDMERMNLQSSPTSTQPTMRRSHSSVGGKSALRSIQR